MTPQEAAHVKAVLTLPQPANATLRPLRARLRTLSEALADVTLSRYRAQQQKGKLNG